jgi:hypothetical protein
LKNLTLNALHSYEALVAHADSDPLRDLQHWDDCLELHQRALDDGIIPWAMSPGSSYSDPRKIRPKSSVMATIAVYASVGHMERATGVRPQSFELFQQLVPPANVQAVRKPPGQVDLLSAWRAQERHLLHAEFTHQGWPDGEGLIVDNKCLIWDLYPQEEWDQFPNWQTIDRNAMTDAEIDKLCASQPGKLFPSLKLAAEQARQERQAEPTREFLLRRVEHDKAALEHARISNWSPSQLKRLTLGALHSYEALVAHAESGPFSDLQHWDDCLELHQRALDDGFIPWAMTPGSSQSDPRKILPKSSAMAQIAVYASVAHMERATGVRPQFVELGQQLVPPADVQTVRKAPGQVDLLSAWRAHERHLLHSRYTHQGWPDREDMIVDNKCLTWDLYPHEEWPQFPSWQSIDRNAMTDAEIATLCASQSAGTLFEPLKLAAEQARQERLASAAGR